MNKIAFIKFGGLATGGTEVFLQTLAVNLSNSILKLIFFIVIQHLILVLTGNIRILIRVEKNMLRIAKSYLRNLKF